MSKWFSKWVRKSKIDNESLLSARQWEQGKRYPTGPTKVLLDLLDKEPHALDYRVKRSNDKPAVV